MEPTLEPRDLVFSGSNTLKPEFFANYIGAHTLAGTMSLVIQSPGGGRLSYTLKEGQELIFPKGVKVLSATSTTAQTAIIWVGMGGARGHLVGQQVASGAASVAQVTPSRWVASSVAPTTLSTASFTPQSIATASYIPIGYMISVPASAPADSIRVGCPSVTGSPTVDGNYIQPGQSVYFPYSAAEGTPVVVANDSGATITCGVSVACYN